jgi:chromosome segregation ATPase
MKIKPIYWISLTLAIAFGFAVCDGLRIRDKYSISIGNYQAALDQSKRDGAALTLQIAKANEIVGQQNAIVIERDKAIGHLTNTIGQKDGELDKIRGTWSKLSAECVQNLKELDATWAQKFSLAQNIIEKKDAIISAWAAKYAAQVTVSESWKQKYNSELHLRTLAEKGWKASERKLRWTRVMGNIKTGIIIAAAIKIGADMIKGT